MRLRASILAAAALGAILALVAEGCAWVAGLGDTPLPELSTDGSPEGTAGSAEAGDDGGDTAPENEAGDSPEESQVADDVDADSSVASNDDGDSDGGELTTDASDAGVTIDSSDESVTPDAPDSTVPGHLTEIPTEYANANPMGYRRSDGVSAIVYRTASGDVIELESSGSYWMPWIPWNLSQLGGATTTAAGDPFGFVRADGTNDVVYLGADGDVHHIEQVSSTWTDSSLTAAGAARGLATGNPSPYVRSDGVSAIVYATADGDVHELALDSQQWKDLDISAAVGAPAAASDPVGFVRNDLANSMIFRGLDNQIYEISSAQATAAALQLSNLTYVSGCGVVQGKPRPYLRVGDPVSIVFRTVSSTPFLRQIGWASGTWRCYDVTVNNVPTLWATGGDPVPWVRSDSWDSVVYRASDGHIIEFALSPNLSPMWIANDLSPIAGAPAAASDPMGFVHADNTNAIVFRSRGDNLTRQIVLIPGGTWVNADPRTP